MSDTLLDDNITIHPSFPKAVGLNSLSSEILSTQHYTTNPAIIEHFEKIPSTLLIEPFVGNGDLLKLLFENNLFPDNLTIEDVLKYDVDPKDEDTIKMDTLKNNVLVEDCYVITNPPWLAKNKMSVEMKKLYKNELVNTNDLYQIFINQLIETKVVGGVIVLPINFILGKQTCSLRKQFEEIYRYKVINILETQVFENTTSATCSIQFERKEGRKERKERKENSYPKVFLNGESIDYNILNKSIFSEFEVMNTYSICRNFRPKLPITKLRLHLLDPNICCEILEEFPTSEDKETDRAIFTVCCDCDINGKEEEIRDCFNMLLEEFRKSTHSLSLSSYREFSRKRLTFEEAIHLLEYVLEIVC